MGRWANLPKDRRRPQFRRTFAALRPDKIGTPVARYAAGLAARP
jgi:hypothetical protein